jgi:hypothetical protein
MNVNFNFMNKSLFILFSFGNYLIFNLAAQNYCLRFWGNGTNDVDRVKIPIDSPESAADVGYSFTIEFQMKASLNDNPLGSSAQTGNNDDWTLGHVIIDRDIFGNGDYGDYGISLAGGKIAFGINNGYLSYTLIGSQLVADDSWHHVAVTRNHTNGEMKIYVDGILDASAMSGVIGDISYRNGRVTSWANDPFIVLGAEKHDYDNSLYPSYNGFLDELRISNNVRYNSNYSPMLYLSDDVNTMLLYHFDEGVGTILQDAALISGSNTQGTIFLGGNPYGPLWILRDTSNTTVLFQNNLQKTISIYPNPFYDCIFLQLITNHEVLKIGFMDVSGRIVSLKMINDYKSKTILMINTVDLESGQYIMFITDNEMNMKYFLRMVKM